MHTSIPQHSAVSNGWVVGSPCDYNNFYPRDYTRLSKCMLLGLNNWPSVNFSIKLLSFASSMHTEASKKSEIWNIFLCGSPLEDYWSASKINNDNVFFVLFNSSITSKNFWKSCRCHCGTWRTADAQLQSHRSTNTGNLLVSQWRAAVAGWTACDTAGGVAVFSQVS